MLLTEIISSMPTTANVTWGLLPRKSSGTGAPWHGHVVYGFLLHKQLQATYCNSHKTEWIFHIGTESWQKHQADLQFLFEEKL